ncbi:MAG: methyl-accepting chemotaxis protein [Amphritea sp.]|nr:methyl-accepting chemotaxis protein [Amphritea sp.]
MSTAFQDLKALTDILEFSPINIMIANIDEEVVFVNKMARDKLTMLENEISQYIPGFRADQIVGGSIHRYHKDPEPIKRVLQAMQEGDVHKGYITPGPYLFEHETRPMYNSEGTKVGYSVQWVDVTNEKKLKDEAERMTSGVTAVGNALMICNEQREITFMNPAARNLLAKRQDTLRKYLPNFDINNLIGANIDIFHRNPAHQSALLADESRLPYTGQIKLDDVVLEITANYIKNAEGQYQGNMVEWRDITDEISTENNINRLISEAGQGNLRERLNEEGLEGFMATLSHSINGLLDQVVKPIRDTSSVVKALAEGDLTKTITAEYSGEFAGLKNSVNASVTNLQGMIQELNEAASNIGTAASEISAGNTDLSQRTEEQASSLEETASSMEEMTSTVKQNADNARDASKLAEAAREQAEKGGSVVKTAVSAMSEINSSSKKIADIIGVIDEIAFQTNILALNAAVEAARAGEQGRGFAVVAAEVRNLAQRSAGAAKEIKSLINDSVEKVEEGSRLVTTSGQSLEEIVSSVKQVSDIVAEIAAASQEQSIGIEQVNKAIMQLEQVTQQNAALVEEAAASSEAMSDQARGLNSLIGFFNTGAAQSSASGAPAAVPARRPAAVSHAPQPTTQAQPAGGDDDFWEEF